jgi:hypothetical protein
MKAQIEFTDTFGGDANYSWVRRAEIDADGLSEAQIVRRLRAAVGLNGARGIREEWQDTIAYRWPSRALIAFITFEY